MSLTTEIIAGKSVNGECDLRENDLFSPNPTQLNLSVNSLSEDDMGTETGKFRETSASHLEVAFFCRTEQWLLEKLRISDDMGMKQLVKKWSAFLPAIIMRSHEFRSIS